MTQERANATRTKARKRALDILYESDVRGLPATVTLAKRIDLGEPPVRPFTETLVAGCAEHAAEIDALLASSLSGNWTLDRLARVDRNLARIALFEALHTDTPDAVAVAEAVHLAGEFSTPSSPAFLSGVLTAALARAGAQPPVTPDPDHLPEDSITE